MREIKSSKAARKLEEGTRVLIVNKGTVMHHRHMAAVDDAMIQTDEGEAIYFDDQILEDLREEGTRFYVID